MELWDTIRTISDDQVPWMIGGDINIVTTISEKVGGPPPDHNAMDDFGSCIIDSGLKDTGFVVYLSRGNGGMYNKGWIELKLTMNGKKFLRKQR